MGIVIIVPMLLAMYFLMIRPQQRRMRQREAMVRSAGVGDEVATVGGVIGIIVAEEGDDVVALEVDTDIELRVQRRAIGEIVTPAGTEEDVVALDDEVEAHEGPISEG